MRAGCGPGHAALPTAASCDNLWGGDRRKPGSGRVQSSRARRARACAQQVNLSAVPTAVFLQVHECKLACRARTRAGKDGSGGSQRGGWKRRPQPSRLINISPPPAFHPPPGDIFDIFHGRHPTRPLPPSDRLLRALSVTGSLALSCPHRAPSLSCPHKAPVCLTSLLLPASSALPRSCTRRRPRARRARREEQGEAQFSTGGLLRRS